MLRWISVASVTEEALTQALRRNHTRISAGQRRESMNQQFKELSLGNVTLAEELAAELTEAEIEQVVSRFNNLSGT